MADTEAQGNASSKSKEMLSLDNWYNKILKYVGKNISTFVAFLFMLFTIGAGFGMLAISHLPEYAPFVILTPAVLGLVAYYNRTIATIAFIVLLIFVLL